MSTAVPVNRPTSFCSGSDRFMVIRRDDQMTLEAIDLANALEYLDRGFSEINKKTGGLTPEEENVCRAAIARLLRSGSPPTELLLSLASVIAPTVEGGGNSTGMLARGENGHLELRHRRKGRVQSPTVDVSTYAKVIAHREANGGSLAAAYEAIHSETGTPVPTLKSQYYRGRDLKNGR